MATNFELPASPREAKGTRASRRLRRAGKVPAVLYGAGKEVTELVLDHDALLHSLEDEAFHSSILKVKTGKADEQAILRDVQMHPYKPKILHVDLQRVSATEKLHMKIPLHFIGEDIAPGVKQQGGIVSHLMTEVDIECLPSNLPEYLEVDISGLSLNDTVHLSEIPLPEGVTITALAHGGDDLGVVTIVAVRATLEEEEEAAEEAEAASEEAAAGEEGAGEEESGGE